MRPMAVSDAAARRSWRRPLTGVAVVAVIGAGLGAYLGIRVAQGAGSAPAAGQPPARTEAAMAYDAADSTLVLFGGEGKSGSLGDTWTWDGSAWTEAHPSVSPPPLAGAKMAYDPVSHDLVLVGGVRVQGSPFDGGVACSSVGSSGSGSASGSSGSTSNGSATFIPPANAIPAIAPAPNGSVATSPPVPSCSVDAMQNTATWLWNGSDWSKAAGTSPSVGYGSWSIATDPVSGHVLLLAPQPFIAEPGVAEPGAGETAPAMACPMPANGNHVVEPACPYYPIAEPTWKWNGHSWTAVKAATNGRYLPFGALGSTVVADPVTGKLAVFNSDLIAIPVTCAPGVACSNAAGASTATCCAGTVTVWDGTGWKHAATFKNGPPLTSGTLVADPAAHGDLYLTADGQTWLWTGSWTRKHPARTPITLNGSAAAYDASTGQVVIFGGFGLTARTDGLYDQTWTWDGTDWTMRGGSATPSVSIPVPSPVSVPPSCSMPPVVKPPKDAIACPMIPAGGVSGSSGPSGASGSGAGSGAVAS